MTPTADNRRNLVAWSRHTYDALAPAYAAANPVIRSGLRPYAQRLIEHVGEGLVLEAGCGAGRDIRFLEAAGARVVGVDQSAAMLARCRQSVRAPVIQADIRHIPLRDAAVAGCWCVATVVHLPPEDLATAFAELARVIAAGGMLVLGTQRGDTSVIEADPYTGRHLRLMSRFSPDTVVDGLTAHGFRVRVENDPDGDLRNWVLVTALRDPA